MIEIRFHGRGGQGAVVASNILAKAAAMEGKDVQSFPYFGVERRGAPVTAFTRIDTKKVYIKSQIYEPDIVIVLDTALMSYVNVAEGLKPDGIVIVNSPESPEEFKDLGKNVYTVDATQIAIDNRLGSKVAPIVNTCLLGAYARITGDVEIKNIYDAIKTTVPVKRDENVNAAKTAFESVKGL